MARLSDYNKKRDFMITSEPPGRVANPTLTIIANALRVADGIAARHF
jgi:hypothetical protein